MVKWLAVVAVITTMMAGCHLTRSTVTQEWGSGFAASSMGYNDQSDIPDTDTDHSECGCNGTGVVVQPDGHRTQCACGDECKCTKVSEVGARKNKTELEWCKHLADQLGCDRETGVEVTLATGTRVDLINDTYAIEVDWADKWAEGCGQALYYSICTGRKPGLLLLLKTSNDKKYVERAAAVAGKHDIALWVYDTNANKWATMFNRGTVEWKQDGSHLASGKMRQSSMTLDMTNKRESLSYRSTRLRSLPIMFINWRTQCHQTRR